MKKASSSDLSINQNGRQKRRKSMPKTPIYAPIATPEEWKALLAEPEKQWRTGFSARAIAGSWLAAKGMPREISAMFSYSGLLGLASIEPLIIIPEHKVFLPPISGHPSQNDVFVLARGSDGSLVSITVEGKVSESFGPTLGEWISRPSRGRETRLTFLKQELSLQGELPPGVRYQLLHRLVSAILEAKRFGARHAVMIIQSFSQTDEWFADFELFLQLYGVKAQRGVLSRLFDKGTIVAYAGWAQGDLRFLAG
ncbi:MAG: hypothetical protein R6X18_07390 [Chloroflexota bacterium]|jgi:hypothetical protein